MIVIAQAETPDDLEAVRGLIREFHHWAMTSLEAPGAKPATFANMDAELAALPGIFGPPTGHLLLARLDGVPAGCVAFFGQDADTMEVKRMYVRPEARGHRIGERLIADLLAEAKRMGYRRYVLSSHHTMHRAHDIYRRAGFVVVPPPKNLPPEVAAIEVFMEMTP